MKISRDKKEEMVTNDYLRSLNGQLIKYKVGFDALYKIRNVSGTYSLVVRMTNDNPYGARFMADVDKSGRKINLIMYDATMKTDNSTQVDKRIETMKAYRKVFEIINKIDYDKLPEVSRADYEAYDLY